MRQRGYISVSVMVRPVRVGLVVRPPIESLLKAVEHATSAWGGMFYPLLSATDEAGSLRLANLLNVDVLFAVDDDPTSQRLSDLPGYQWRGGAPYGPFDSPSEGLKLRVIEPPVLICHQYRYATRGMNIVQWDPSDPLDPLYGMCFGRYYNTEYGEQLTAQYAQQAKASVNAEDMSNDAFIGCPLAATADEIEYWGDGEGIGFFLLDPDNPLHLMGFWNLRAAGAALFPLPRGHEERFLAAAEAWLDLQLNEGRIPRYMRGSGEIGELYVRVNAPDDLPTPERLVQALSERNVEERRSDENLLTRGWRGTHPLHTEFSKLSTLTVERNSWAIDIPTPELDFLPRRERLMGSGTVAVQLDVFSEVDLPQDAVLAIPNRRDLAVLLSNYVDYPEPFHRPAGDGRVIGVQAGCEHVSIRLTPSFSILESFFEGSPWQCSQTDNGRFGARLIDLVGGIPRQAGNQPAVRAVLSKAARSGHRGRPLAALIEYAKSDQDDWPGLFGSAQARRDYGQNVVYTLLSRKLLRPILPIRCPNCRTESHLTPDDLRSDFACEMCGEEFPLGLVLALNRKTNWLYRLSGNIDEDRLLEVFPIMATLSVLSRYRAISDRNPPHVLGLKLRGQKDFCEIDLAVALDDGGWPIVVIGEAKSFRDQIDQNDLTNLLRVQEYLRNQKIETFLLAATMRESLESEEVKILRSLCENAQETLTSNPSRKLAFPFVLTGRDLSLPEHAPDHPMRWDRSSFSFADLAITSCKRNLGLIEVNWQRGSDGYQPLLRWT